MKRRDFLEKLVVGGGGAAMGATAVLAACAGAQDEGAGAPAVQTQKKVRWRLASSFPRSVDVLYGSAELVAERVNAMSGGNFEIRCYPAGELVPGLQVMDAVQQGTVQAGQTASYYYKGKNPALAFDACVPFGFTSRQQTAWLEEAGGRALMDELFGAFGIKTFCCGNTGTQMGGWFKNPLGGLADLEGLKMRIPGLGGEVMAALGVNVQVLAGGEIYPALERGAIDATEWVGPYDDEQLGFHKVAKHYLYPGWWEPGASLSLYVGTKAWNELPAEYQAMFSAACREASLVMQAQYDARNPAALQRILASGVTMSPFSDDIMQAASTASEALLQDYASKDAGYKKVLDHWDAFRKASNGWMGAAETAYAKFAFNPGG